MRMARKAQGTAPARLPSDAGDDVSRIAHWIVIKHPFNAAWYPQLVDSQGEGDPPSYAVVRIEWGSSAREV
jgi:hypothetical protein